MSHFMEYKLLSGCQSLVLDYNETSILSNRNTVEAVVISLAPGSTAILMIYLKLYRGVIY